MPRLDSGPELRRGTAAPSSARPHGRGTRSNPGADRPRPERLRAGGLLAALVGALRVQAFRAPAAPPPERGRARPAGPRRERRRARSRRGTRGRLQGRVAQPPVGGRAVPGRCDGCRRDPPRHLGDGCAPDRAARRSPVRRRRLAPVPRRRRDRPVRELRRRPERRRRGRPRRALPRQLPRQRDVRRPAPRRAADEREGDGRGRTRRALRRDDRSRRDRRRLGAREPGARGGVGRQAAVRPGR